MLANVSKGFGLFLEHLSAAVIKNLIFLEVQTNFNMFEIYNPYNISNKNKMTDSSDS